MGTSKAQLLFRGRSLAVHAAGILEKAGLTPIVVTAPDQPLDVGTAGRICDLRPDRGPLSGLHAALATTQEAAVCVLACDLPLVDPEVFRHLAGLAGTCDVAVPEDAQGNPQPLCALYARSCLPRVEQLLETGGGPRHLLHHPELRVQRISAADLGWPDHWFLNLNTPADLVRLQQVQAQLRNRG